MRAERAVLAALGGSCTVPVGAWAEAAEGTDALRVSGMVASGDGRIMIRLTALGDDPEEAGAALARALLEGGGAAIDGFAAAAETAAAVEAGHP